MFFLLIFQNYFTPTDPLKLFSPVLSKKAKQKQKQTVESPLN